MQDGLLVPEPHYALLANDTPAIIVAVSWCCTLTLSARGLRIPTLLSLNVADEVAHAHILTVMTFC
ncbi:hypothetical protein OGY17_08690 [Citrobacter sp. Cpo126]|nr:hypothetical protein [Citrobacter sp. Cpo126]MDM2772724.1 hypothetical protein [Citrobacter sp. Cpo126]